MGNRWMHPRRLRPRRRRLTPRDVVMRLLERLDEFDQLGMAGGGACDDHASGLRDTLLCWKTDVDLLLALQPPQDQALVRLLGRKRLDRKQVADIFGITPVALRSRLYRIAGRLLRGGFTL